MKFFGGFRIVASTVWIGWIRGYENPNVNGFQILWQKRFSAKTKCPHRSCSIDSLEKRLLLARGNAANSMWLPRMPKKTEKRLFLVRKGISGWSVKCPYLCFLKCYISMLLEMLYIYVSLFLKMLLEKEAVPHWKKRLFSEIYKNVSARHTDLSLGRKTVSKIR